MLRLIKYALLLFGFGICMNIYKWIIIFISVFLSLSTSAQLLGFKYTDTNSVSVEKDANQLQNPSSQSTILVTAGLSRIITYNLTKDGVPIDSGQSSLINVQDRFSYQGSYYYGKSFTTSSVLVSGTYFLTYTIKDHLGTTVSIGRKSFIVDVIPPTFGLINASEAYGSVGGTNAVYKLGTGAGRGNFQIDSVTDDNGINRVYFKVYRADGSLYREADSAYDQSNSRVIQPYGNIFPSSDLDEAFTFIMFYEDKAGNIGQSSVKTVYFDNQAPSVPVFAVYDPSSNRELAPGLLGFEPYVAGMPVKTNPINIAFKIAKHDWHTYREAGLNVKNSLDPVEIVHTDTNFVYLTIQAPYGNTNSNYLRFVNFSAWA